MGDVAHAGEVQNALSGEFDALLLQVVGEPHHLDFEPLELARDALQARRPSQLSNALPGS